MKTFTQIYALKQYLQNHNSIGFVPTMGALHQGHLSLIRASKTDNTLTICSIFVNPLQFNSSTDFEKYPNTIANDILLLESEKCDVLFLPEYAEIYPKKCDTTIDFGYQNTILEGKFRPGHFNGVGVVVSKLFNIVKPNIAYFGQKDFQQCLVIKQLVRDLSFDIKLKIIETLREFDGLAMSSRNVRLSADDRKLAANIYKALQLAGSQAHVNDCLQIKNNILAFLATKEKIEVEYADFLDYESGKLILNFKKNRSYVLCIAVHIGTVRLIDNFIINP